MPEIAVAIFVNHFDVRQCGFAARAPVDQPFGAIEQLVFPKFDESLAHGARQAFVHGEALMLPIARNPERLQLMENGVAGLLLPLPDPFDKFFPPKLRPSYARLRQLPFDDVLRGDAGVIRARHPEHAEAVHSFVAAQDILQRIVERMAHVQRTGDIRRRNHD